MTDTEDVSDADIARAYQESVEWMHSPIFGVCQYECGCDVLADKDRFIRLGRTCNGHFKSGSNGSEHPRIPFDEGGEVARIGRFYAEDVTEEAIATDPSHIAKQGEIARRFLMGEDVWPLVEIVRDVTNNEVTFHPQGKLPRPHGKHYSPAH